MSINKPKLEIKNISLNLGDEEVIKDLNLSIFENEIVSILGASASGKTSLLRVIAGFENICSGVITLNQKVVNNQQKTVQPELRNIGIIFQDLALFPHLTVSQNIAFGIMGVSDQYKIERCKDLQNILGIGNISEKFPHQISGGQQQRVAIARAIAPKPEMLLLDEPFSAIDEELREQLVKDVKNLLKNERITTILITHNVKEAFGLSDKVAFLSEKKISQYDTPYNIYHKPISREISNFFGISSYIKGKILDNNNVKTSLGTLFGESTKPYTKGQKVDVLIRPDDVIHDDESADSAKVVDKIFHGSDFLYELELIDGQRIFCYTPSHHNHSINEMIGIKMQIDHLIIFNL
ncbi:MAG: ABC transporter ATP-binding protein [Pseudomonadota bacterium]|nr:ABC transporter ATP-binding protein [Pseudomonadota bacterium]